MSDNIPFEIQVEILKRLPVKSIIQFRSVSKAWKFLFDSSDFIALYNASAQHTQPQHLLLCEGNDVMGRYETIVDDNTFTQQRVILTKTPLLNLFTSHWVYGYSHGVLCFYSCCLEDHGGQKSSTRMVVLWNPSIRKAVGVIVPNVTRGKYRTHIGFGVCRETVEPKLVRITHVRRHTEGVSSIPWKFEIFTLGTGVWRSPYGKLPRKSVRFGYGWIHQVTLDGFIYWIATDKSTMDGRYSLLISFDITTEDFGEVNLCDSLALEKHTNHNFSISKLRNSLVVLDYDEDVNSPVYVVWMMEDAVFTKLFTVNVNTQLSTISGFTKSGAPIVECREVGRSELVVYEPNSKHVDRFWINQNVASVVDVHNYTETLVLHDEPDLMVYNGI